MDAGADPNQVAGVVDGLFFNVIQGDTLLGIAIRSRDIMMAELLLNYGASPIIVNMKTGLSAVELIRNYDAIFHIEPLIKIIYSRSSSSQRSESS